MGHARTAALPSHTQASAVLAPDPRRGALATASRRLGGRSEAPPLALVAALSTVAALSLPGTALAYDRQVSLDVAAGWAIAPGLEAPDHGPVAGLGATIGFDDTWGLGAYAAWAVHPAFNVGEPFQVGLFGLEALYYIDILEVVPFFGLGIDVLPSYDGLAMTWAADFAAHLRVSVDYLVSREVAVGADVRGYVLLTALSTEPVYLTFQLRLSVLLDY